MSQIPPTLLDITDDIAKRTEDQGLKDEVELKKDKVQMKLDKFKEFSNKVVEKMLVSEPAKGTNVVIMLGGFSESDFLQNRIKNSFPNHTVVIPQGCGLAVLKGAVVFGHDPDIIAARMVKYTYSVRSNIRFIKDKR